MRQTVSNILREVAEQEGVPVGALTSPSRLRRYVRPRQLVYYRAFTECPWLSLPEIGRRIGNRDHTTVIHGIRVHCARIGVDYRDISARRYEPDPVAFSHLISAYSTVMEAAYVH